MEVGGQHDEEVSGGGLKDGRGVGGVKEWETAFRQKEQFV